MIGYVQTQAAVSDTFSVTLNRQNDKLLRYAYPLSRISSVLRKIEFKLKDLDYNFTFISSLKPESFTRLRAVAPRVAAL